MNPTVRGYLNSGALIAAIENLEIPDGTSAPQESEFRRWLGVILERGLAYEEALGEYRAAVAADPTSIVARRRLINLLVRETFYTEAKEEVLALIATDLRGFDGYPILFRIFKALGAEDELEPVLDLLKQNQSRKPLYYTEVAKYYLAEGRVTEASRLVNEFLASGRRDAAILELQETIQKKMKQG